VTSFQQKLYSNTCTAISGAFVRNMADMSPTASPYQTACNNSYGVFTEFVNRFKCWFEIVTQVWTLPLKTDRLVYVHLVANSQNILETNFVGTH